MRLDRKLLLIAPAIILVLLFLGIAYTATQLHVLASVSNDWAARSQFITAVAHGTKPLTERQAVEMLQYSVAAEKQRTDALIATWQLLAVLAAVGLVCCGSLAVGIRGVPREHWPRFTRGRSAGT
ncbi:MAG TPA: hypothetical protein VFJ95_14585 [Gammaproteobacteria bacterium]|nr:hypothetical protein [Gammaproteobacteria bacterium]